MKIRIGDWVESRVDFVHLTRRRGYASGRLVGPGGLLLRGDGAFSFPPAGDTRYPVDRPTLRDVVAAREKAKRSKS